MENVRYSEIARKVLEGAQRIARDSGSGYVGTEHLLLGILSNGESTGCAILNRYCIDERSLSVRCREGVRIPAKEGALPFSPALLRVLDHARRLSSEDRAPKMICTEHLLSALLETPGCAAYKLISEQGANAEDMIEDLAVYLPVVRGNLYADSPARERTVSEIEKYASDMVFTASQGGFDRVIGREEECALLMGTLCRKNKNNPCLIGEPGVGKTAIVEEVARKIFAGEAPEQLKNTAIYALDMTRLLAGTKYRGDFEERLKKVVAEAEERNAILFIDEIHTLIGAGAQEGASDAANILKPSLARGRLRVIGATTFGEYRKRLEKDKAFIRRFRTLTIGEPTAIETKVILEGVKNDYERYHGIVIEEDAITEAVRLSDRFCPDRFFPDKALDLLDDACVSLRMNKSGADRLGAEDVRRTAQASYGAESSPAFGEHLIKALRKTVIGQERALGEIARVFSLLPQDRTKKPRAVLLFTGPKGSGRSFLAESLAQAVSGGERGFLRIDLCEYSEKSGLSGLIGSPPGYVGYGEGAVLTDHVQRALCPVILIENYDTARIEIKSLFQRICEEGTIRDGAGKTVGFRGCILIFTADRSKNGIRQKAGFLPDESVTFDSFDSGIAYDGIIETDLPDRETLFGLADHAFFGIAKRMESAGVTLTVDEGAIRCLCSKRECPRGYAAAVSFFVRAFEKAVSERMKKKPEEREIRLQGKDFE